MLTFIQVFFISSLFIGVAFYDDLNRPLLLAEAENAYKYITDLAKLILPSVVTSMNGGFRR